MTTDPTTRAAQRIADIIAEETTEHGHVEPNTMERWREVILGEMGGAERDEPDYRDRDCYGRPIPKGETPDTVIRAWKITPHPATCSDYDYVLERSYQRAVRAAAEALEDLMDQMEDGDERSVTVETIEMRLSDYLEGPDDDE